MTGGLAASYGGHFGAEPILTWTRALIGRPVRIRVIDGDCEHWIRGHLTVGMSPESLLTEVENVELAVTTDNGGMLSTVVDTGAGGYVVWDSPRRRVLSIAGYDDTRREIHDDREICRLDVIEDELAEALTEEDPHARHDKLAAVRASANYACEKAISLAARSRMAALSVFLEEYRDPTSG